MFHFLVCSINSVVTCQLYEDEGHPWHCPKLGLTSLISPSNTILNNDAAATVSMHVCLKVGLLAHTRVRVFVHTSSC